MQPGRANASLPQRHRAATRTRKHTPSAPSARFVSCARSSALRSAAYLLGILALGSACASAPLPSAAAAAPRACPPPELALSLATSERVNPTPDGQGRPVQVRVYQLASDARLRGASFEAIWQTDKEALQADLLAVDQYSLFPGTTKEVAVKPNPQAHYLALVALFREPQGKDWFLSFELAEPAASTTCPVRKPRLGAWLDRMQIQDGDGRADESASPQPAKLNEGR